MGNLPQYFNQAVMFLAFSVICDAYSENPASVGALFSQGSLKTQGVFSALDLPDGLLRGTVNL